MDNPKRAWHNFELGFDLYKMNGCLIIRHSALRQKHFANNTYVQEWCDKSL